MGKDYEAIGARKAENSLRNATVQSQLHKYRTVIEDEAKKHGINPSTIAGMLLIESNIGVDGKKVKEYVIGDKGASKGIAQFQRGTWYGRAYDGLPIGNGDWENAQNPVEAIRATARLIKTNLSLKQNAGKYSKEDEHLWTWVAHNRGGGRANPYASDLKGPTLQGIGSFKATKPQLDLYFNTQPSNATAPSAQAEFYPSQFNENIGYNYPETKLQEFSFEYPEDKKYEKKKYEPINWNYELPDFMKSEPYNPRNFNPYPVKELFKFNF